MPGIEWSTHVCSNVHDQGAANQNKVGLKAGGTCFTERMIPQCGINKDYVELLSYYIRAPKQNKWEHNGSPLNTAKVQHWSKLTGHRCCLQFGFCAQKDRQTLNYLLGLEWLQKRCKGERSARQFYKTFCWAAEVLEALHQRVHFGFHSHKLLRTFIILYLLCLSGFVLTDPSRQMCMGLFWFWFSLFKAPSLQTSIHTLITWCSSFFF